MKRKKVLYGVGIIILASLLVGAGLYQLQSVYESHQADMLAYESRHLDSIVSSSGRGLAWMLGGYEAQAANISHRIEARRAEEAYRQGGDIETLKGWIRSPEARRAVYQNAVAVYDGDALLAASSENFPVGTGEDKPVDEYTALRIGTDGTMWFVFFRQSDGGLTYEIAVTVKDMFAACSATARVGQSGYLFLLDADQRYFCAARDGEIFAGSVSQLQEQFPNVDSESLTAIAASRQAPPEAYSIYRYPWGGDSRSYGDNTLVVTYPISLDQSGFVMGAAVSFQEFEGFFNTAIRQMTRMALTEIGGMLLLLVVAAWLYVANQKKEMELEIWKERTELMEEVNRQQLSLAHTERLQQLGIMTSGIAHEFNNLLTPIMGQSVLLLEELADQEESSQFENALDIYEAAEKARSILKRMSSLSRKGEDERFRPLELGGLLQKTANMASLGKTSHIHIQTVLPEDELYISGNEQLLSQAFLNLCINACQAMGERGGTLTLSLTREKRTGPGYALVSVSDTGPGIPEEHMDFLYEPFYSTKKEEGTGLGLAICLKIIENHKGTIAAANRPEGGAVFTVRLPLIDKPEDE